MCVEGRTLGLIKKEHRSYRECLIKDVQSLPHCDLYTLDKGIYYCRSRHCAIGATEISIGALEVQKACTKFNLLPQGTCAYYARPKSTDVELACGVDGP